MAVYTSIKDKVTLITGAGSGIGYAIVEALLHSGGKVVLNDIDELLAANVAAAFNKKFPDCCYHISGDAGSIEVIDKMLEFTLSKFGKLDFAIANAGITTFGDFFEFTPQDFEKIMKVNLQGAFFLTQKATSIMRKQGKGGRIVLMSSITGIQSYPDLSAYSMTKAALRMMARNLVLALAPHKITINAIAPGATLTERTHLEEPDYEGTWSKIIPLGSVGKPADIAGTCLFLLSDEAAHITGQTLVVDGGWTVVGRYPNDLE